MHGTQDLKLPARTLGRHHVAHGAVEPASADSASADSAGHAAPGAAEHKTAATSDAARCTEAATCIQAAARGWLARRCVARVRRERAMHARRKRAACWRAHAGRVQLSEKCMRCMLLVWASAESRHTQLLLKAQVRCRLLSYWRLWSR